MKVNEPIQEEKQFIEDTISRLVEMSPKSRDVAIQLIIEQTSNILKKQVLEREEMFKESQAHAENFNRTVNNTISSLIDPHLVQEKEGR